MAERYCHHCGMGDTSSEPTCLRCRTAHNDRGRAAYFDTTTGVAIDRENAPALRCWHCGQPIEQQTKTCPHCATQLTDTANAAFRYDVVPRTSAPPPPVKQDPGDNEPASTKHHKSAVTSIDPAAQLVFARAAARDAEGANWFEAPQSIATSTDGSGDGGQRGYCFHCGYRSGGARSCRRCGADFTTSPKWSQNFDVETGEDLSSDETGRGEQPTTDPNEGEGKAASESASPSGPSRWNIIARNWRGELPLWVSFWIFGVLFYPAFFFTSDAIIDALPPPTGPIAVFVWVVAVWLVFIAVFAWQLIGLFRAARRRRRMRQETGRGAFWAVAAMVLVGLLAIEVSAAVALGATDQLRTIIDIAFLGDPDIPDFRVEIHEDTATITISGGIKFGLAQALEEALLEAPGTRTLVLSSPGGRIGPAELAFDVVREHGLSTHVDRYCDSACTIVFAAGVQRTLSASGRLGYHSASSGLRLDNDRFSIDEHFREVMHRVGFDSGFVDRVLRVPPWDIWYPSTNELTSAGAITSIQE